MAAAFQKAGFVVIRYSCRVQCRRKQWPPAIKAQSFHTNPVRRALRVPDDEEEAALRKYSKGPWTFNYDDLSPEERHQYDLLSPDEKRQWQAQEKANYEHMTSPAVESELQGYISQALSEINQENPREKVPERRIKPGLMAMGEVDEQDSGEDEDFDGDDITSIAHGELEQHREMREYARIAAWEMPMLSSAPYNPIHPLSANLQH